MENAQIAEVFEEIADILEIEGENPFRVRSYHNAARTVRDLPERIQDLVREGRDLKKLPGIGSSIAEQISEILVFGTSHRLKELRSHLPESLLDLLRVRGLGPKKVKKLHDELGIKSLDELEKAAREGRIRDLPGMGAKTEQKILEGIDRAREGVSRMLLRDADAAFESFAQHLDQIASVERFSGAGSRRRRRETIGDLDVLVQASNRPDASKAILAYDGITTVEAQGEEKLTLVLHGRLNVDVRFFEAEAFGAALMYFTGSKTHNIEVRRIAQDKGYKLNEYGLYEGDERVAGTTEEEVYAKLGLVPIPPELRENRGEVEAAAKGNLPELLVLDDIKGDLHAHTTETDGQQSIVELAQAARQKGYGYVAVTDHTKQVAIAHGMDDERLRRHAECVREHDAEFDDLWLMTGVEVDVLKNGSLDIDEKLLAELDWVVASIHSHFELEEKQMTDRLLVAIRSGVVDCLGHPFTRQFGLRDSIHIDVDRVFEACRDHGVCLELNAQPERLDLPDIYCHRAKDLGIPVAVATDAHKLGDLGYMRYGVATARRGWLEKANVVNTLDATTLRQRLGRDRSDRWRDL